jgi:hypothetical protein
MNKIDNNLRGMETHPAHPFAIQIEHTLALVNRAGRLCRCSSEACWYSRHCQLELTHSTAKSISEYPAVTGPPRAILRTETAANLCHHNDSDVWRTSSEPLLHCSTAMPNTDVCLFVSTIAMASRAKKARIGCPGMEPRWLVLLEGTGGERWYTPFL